MSENQPISSQTQVRKSFMMMFLPACCPFTMFLWRLWFHSLKQCLVELTLSIRGHQAFLTQEALANIAETTVLNLLSLKSASNCPNIVRWTPLLDSGSSLGLKNNWVNECAQPWFPICIWLWDVHNAHSMGGLFSRILAGTLFSENCMDSLWWDSW